MAPKLELELLSTDFDGTLHAEYESPPVPLELQSLIAALQAKGMAWVINTGRDLSSLLETLDKAKLSIWPDFVVTVEREIHERVDAHFEPVQEWNSTCHAAHAELFARVHPELPPLVQWIRARFRATIYEDPFSPFCLIAQTNGDADEIQHHIEAEVCARIPHLTYVRNDVYARFSHDQFNKGTALAEIARRLGIGPARIAAAGDHLNDLPMLSRQYARWLLAPGNAVYAVKELVRKQEGYVSSELYGNGLVDGLKTILNGQLQGLSVANRSLR